MASSLSDHRIQLDCWHVEVADLKPASSAPASGTRGIVVDVMNDMSLPLGLKMVDFCKCTLFFQHYYTSDTALQILVKIASPAFDCDDQS